MNVTQIALQRDYTIRTIKSVVLLPKMESMQYLSRSSRTLKR